MSWGKEQEQEIKTIKERALRLKLSSADCDRIALLCGRYGLGIAELFEHFIGDLIDGTYSNGSDERRLAREWFDRCGFSWEPDKTLLKFWLEWYGEPEDLLGLIDDIEELKNEISAETDQDEIDELLGELEQLEEELQGYKDEYQEQNPGADWSAEVELVKKWVHEKNDFIGKED